MRVVVCVKQVPDATNVRINPKTNTLMREGVESIVNPFDEYALEEGLRLKDAATGATREIAASGAFVAIGHEPTTKFLSGQVALDPAGYVVVDRQRTNVPGVFAAGDCADPHYKQAVVAAGAGAMAALEATAYLRGPN